MGGSGSDLVYTDDDEDSYAAIFDNSVFDSTSADHQRVIEALRALSEGENLEEYINVDEVLRYIAANTVLVNLDSYFGTMEHNYYLYEEDGQIAILPWDYNLSFAGFQSGSASGVPGVMLGALGVALGVPGWGVRPTRCQMRCTAAESERSMENPPFSQSMPVMPRRCKIKSADIVSARQTVKKPRRACARRRK